MTIERRKSGPPNSRESVFGPFRREVPALDLPVPGGLLDLPFRHDLKSILRYEAGLFLDLHLRRFPRKGPS